MTILTRMKMKNLKSLKSNISPNNSIMKKIAIIALGFFALAAASCGGGAAQTDKASATDSAAQATVQAAKDSAGAVRASDLENLMDDAGTQK